MPLTDSEASLERAWGHSPAAFESWPVPGDLPVSKEALAAVLDAAPSESIELMRAARVPGDRMPHVEPPARGADLVRRLARESLVLRLGNLAPILPAAADWVDGYRELVRALFGARAVRRGDVRADLYLASPDAVSRFHADPSHNLVHQARGRRRLRVFSARDARLTGPGMRSRVFLLRGEHPRYRAECEDDATEIELAPGTGAYVPILAGHWVGNGPEPSVSYTISIRTPEVLVEKRCHEFNARLERLGARPATYGRHGLRDRFKARIETLLHHTLPIRARRPDQDVTWDREADSSARS